jgi:hypothetical protein
MYVSLLPVDDISIEHTSRITPPVMPSRAVINMRPTTVQ